LNKELKEVRGEMFGKGVDVPSGLQIVVGGADYNLKWVVDSTEKIISLKDVLTADTFCGIRKEKGDYIQDRLKIVLLAYEHYDQIMNGNHVTLTAAERKTYGVDADNKQAFLDGVKKLRGSSSKELDVVFLPSVDEIKSKGNFGQD
jgi:hypothetical protein